MDECDNSQCQSMGRERERRQHVRHQGASLPDLSTHVREQAVRLIDVSTRGALVETDDHLVPGRTISIRFVTSDTEFTLTGKTVRTWVSGLSGTTITYQTALFFSEDNPLSERVLGEQRSGVEALPPFRAAWSEHESVLQLVAAVHQSTTELKRSFMANEW